MFINMFNTNPSYYNESKNARTVTWTINNNGHLDAVSIEEFIVNNNIICNLIVKDINGVRTLNCSEMNMKMLYEKYNELVEYTHYLKTINEKYIEELNKKLGNFTSYANSTYGWKINHPYSSNKIVVFLPIMLDNTTNKNIVVVSGKDILNVDYTQLEELLELFSTNLNKFLQMSDHLVFESLLNNLDDLKVSSNKELMNIIDNIEKMGL